MADPTAIHPDIPLDKAWRAGRRIYVRAGYQSHLNDQMRALGAKWDPEAKALWVGTGKAQQVVPLVQAQVSRVAASADVKARGQWVHIPFDAEDVRTRARALGGVYDGDRKDWAMPTDQAFAEVSTAVTDWSAKRAAAKATAKAAARETAGKTAAEREGRVIAGSDRTVTGERGQANGQLHGRMRRPEAEQRKPQPGEVRHLPDGRRVLVLTSRVEFASQDAIDDGLVGLPPYAEPGWYFSYEFAEVRPTAAEIEEDRRVKAELDDGAEIDAVMRLAERTAQRREVDTLSPLAGPSITMDAAGGMTVHGGRITVTDRGVWWQHPGYYDDFRRTEGMITDAALLARILAIIAAGPRRRGQYRVAT